MGGHGSGRKPGISSFFGSNSKSDVQFSEGQKSKGLLDDYAERQNIDTKEGTIQKVPVNAKDIVNKTYVDDAVAAGDTTLANTKIWIGDAAGAKQEFALSGDATMTAGGVVTIDHVNINSIGTNTHAQIDTHISSGAIHFTSASVLSDNLYLQSGALMVVFDGGGSVIGDATQIDLVVPYNCTIKEAYALADQSGSATIAVWNDTLGNFPPTTADNITAGGIIISADDNIQDTSLTGWTTSLTEGDVLRFNMSGASTAITQLTAQLMVTKS